jgi:mono/diheme cytochrome c family protein
MRNLLAAGFVFLFVSCSTSTPPEVTEEMARGRAGGVTDAAQLRHGRMLFVSRCIECHTLPPVAAHSAGDWPYLIKEMGDRAHLKPNERNAVLAYILAAREQQ